MLFNNVLADDTLNLTIFFKIPNVNVHRFTKKSFFSV